MPITLEEAAKGLIQVEETEEVQPDVEQEEVSAEAEEVEVDEVEEVTSEDDDQPETDEAEDDEVEEAEDDDDDPLLQIETRRGIEEVRFSELQDGYMRTKDYTQKTQELADQRRASAEEIKQARESIQQQTAQLQEALATFAVSQEPEPNWAEVPPEQFGKTMQDWKDKQAQQQQAGEIYRELQARQQADVVARETEALFSTFPEWRDTATFTAAAKDMVETGGQYGFSPEEMAGITDHRMFRVLHELRQLKASSDVRKTSAAKVTKRIAKIAKKPAPGSKPTKSQASQKAYESKRNRLKKTGSIQDAAALLIMEQ